jgi:hypothetical protein
VANNLWEVVMKPELPSTPVSIGGVLDSGFRLFRETYSRSWPPALVVALAGIAFGIAEALMLQEQSGAGAGLFSTVQSLAKLGETFRPQVFAGTLLLYLVGSVCCGAVLIINRALLQGDASISAAKALAKSLGRLPALVACGVLYILFISVATMLAAFVVIFLAFLLGLLIPGLFSQGVGPLQVLLISLGVVLYLIPAIYIVMKLQLALAVLFLEDAGPVSALRTSWKLTRGRWWRGFAIISVAGILLYLFSAAFSLLGIAAAGLITTGMQERVIVTTIVGHIASLLVTPAFMAIYLALYNDFKLRSEGGDLAARAAALGQA